MAVRSWTRGHCGPCCTRFLLDLESLRVLLDHAHTSMAVREERRILAQLGGGCLSPVAAYVNQGTATWPLRHRVGGAALRADALQRSSGGKVRLRPLHPRRGPKKAPKVKRVPSASSPPLPQAA